MEYLVVEATSASSLQSKVQEHVTEGYVPIGGLSVANNGTLNWWFYQAMVRRWIKNDEPIEGAWISE